MPRNRNQDTQFCIRISEDLLQKLDNAALANCRSRADYICVLLERELSGPTREGVLLDARTKPFWQDHTTGESHRVQLTEDDRTAAERAAAERQAASPAQKEKV